MPTDRSQKLTNALADVDGVTAVRVTFDGDRTYTAKVGCKASAKREVHEMADLFASNFKVTVKLTGF